MSQHQNAKCESLGAGDTGCWGLKGKKALFAPGNTALLPAKSVRGDQNHQKVKAFRWALPLLGAHLLLGIKEQLSTLDIRPTPQSRASSMVHSIS